MKKDLTCAVILSETKNGERIVSCGGRISTRPGTAIELYKSATDKEKNLNLISKVVASGHKTVLEHHYFNLAFNNVSLFVEQYLIEFRLAAFTIKSGRYVNFSNAGFNLPSGFSEEQKSSIKKHYKDMFALYSEFVDAGIPVEDARFVLPYGVKTNIYMSVNARELIHIICTMIYGRGSRYEEIFKLGQELKTQFDLRYPGLIEKCKKDYLEPQKPLQTPKNIEKIEFVTKTNCKLMSSSSNAYENLNNISQSLGQGEFNINNALKDDKLAKMLEHFNYTFSVKDFSLIILKHYTRHRIQSLSTMPLYVMAEADRFVIPESINARKDLKKKFIDAINQNRKLYNSLIGVDPALLVYVMPNAAAINFVATLNARELLHFMNLRTCNRAQWEIRYLAEDMLKQLKKKDPKLFSSYGPSCYTFGVCPEGRLCCGKQAEIKEKFKSSDLRRLLPRS